MAKLGEREAIDLGAFREQDRARGSIDALSEATGVSTQQMAGLVEALAAASDPDRAILGLERCLLGQRDPAPLLERLIASQRTARSLATVLGASPYLTEILIRHPSLLDSLFDFHRRLRVRTRSGIDRQIRDSAEWRTTATPGREELRAAGDALRRVKQEELLRIGASDLLVLFDLVTVTEQLSLLADAMVGHSLDLAARSLGLESAPEGFVVLAFGKLGGRELNYSSDIDLVYLAAERPDGFWQLGRRLRDLMSEATPEGFLYRVDLRLRPWGRDGELVHTTSSYRRYLESRASPAELQSLIKARPVAGDLELGSRFLEECRDLVFPPAETRQLRSEIRSLKERIERDLRRRGREWGEVKAGVGSIRDVEFATQFLQKRHAPHHDLAGLRSGNTLTALSALYDAGLISQADHHALVPGYVFLRTVEHYLQLATNHQAHTLPRDRDQLAPLARRLGFEGEGAIERFLQRYEEHGAAIRQVFRRHLEEPESSQGTPEPVSFELAMPASYAETFSDEEIARHRRLAREIGGDRKVAVHHEQIGGDRYQIEIVGEDRLGNLSLICGLLYAYGFNIQDGRVFTAEAARGRKRRRIVDAFTVRVSDPERLSTLEKDLQELLLRHHQGPPGAAQAELAKQIALVLPDVDPKAPLLPIDVEIDNSRSAAYTVLVIEGQDTLGFLYELTNALSLADVSIEQVDVRTDGSQVRDTLFVTDKRGRKIVDPRRLGQLRVAVALTKHFTHLLPRSPDPEQALLAFRQLLADLLDRDDWEQEIATLDQPAALANLARLLGVSDFLWQDFLRMQHRSLFPLIGDTEGLREPRARRALEQELDRELGAAAPEEARGVLNAFKDREMFRIDMRKILGHGSAFDQFSRELTELAEIVFDRALSIAEAELATRHPPLTDERGRPLPISLCALGKFGGRELGFASDLEIMLVYDHGASEDQSARLAARAGERCSRLVERLLALVESKKEGIFEIDLRLRPHGSGGPLAVSTAAFESYFGPDGEAWPYERQALLKLRPIAGSRSLGKALSQLRDRLVYRGIEPDTQAQRALRERQIRHRVTPGTVNAKYSRGCLVDVEYLVQLLQLRHGRDERRVRNPNTLAAIDALFDAGAIDARDYDVLVGAYRFFRLLIDALRMVRGHAKDLTVPPPSSDQLRFLGRRFGSDPEVLLSELERHMMRVPRLEARLLGNRQGADARTP